MKKQRSLSGVYFRVKNEKGEMDAIAFEDLSEEDQDRIMMNRSEIWLKDLAKKMANTINRLAEELDR